ncbi:hypothetical protein [Paraburkholderia sp. MM5477-R1]|uniref:hypothetical protein n=1 Tax=Paraburkholderia sp. MM5477-R1 TaxID=2991062 RepID=UPI003D217083
MSHFAIISARRLRNLSAPLTDHERLSVATLIEVLDHDLGRAQDALHRIAHLIGDIEPGIDLTVALPVLVAALVDGERP